MTHNVDHLSSSEQSALAWRLGWCLPREMVQDVECTPHPKARWSRDLLLLLLAGQLWAGHPPL